MALLATTRHPNGVRVEYRETKGQAMMEQRWSTGQRYTIPRDWLNGLLADIETIHGIVNRYDAEVK